HRLLLARSPESLRGGPIDRPRPLHRLDPRRLLGRSAARDPQPTRHLGGDRLVPGRDRLDQHPRQVRRRPHRTQPGRPRQTGNENPCHGRPERPALERPDLGRERPRQAPTGAHRRPDPPDQAAFRQAQAPPGQHADKGYDYDDCRTALRTRGIIPRIARKGIESSQRLGRYRWVVERTFSWLTGFRRLSPRYERHGHLYLGMVTLAAALTC